MTIPEQKRNHPLGPFFHDFFHSWVSTSLEENYLKVVFVVIIVFAYFPPCWVHGAKENYVGMKLGFLARTRRSMLVCPWGRRVSEYSLWLAVIGSPQNEAACCYTT